MALKCSTMCRALHERALKSFLFASAASADAKPRSANGGRLRSLPDRLRQIALYEAGGLLLISPIFSVTAGISRFDSVSLLGTLAIVAALWNGVYSTLFDWFEWRGAAGARTSARL